MLKNFTIISLLLAALLFGSGFSSDSTLSVERNSSSNFLQTFKIERISEANLQYLIKRFSKELNIEEETIEEESSQEKPTDHQETEKNGEAQPDPSQEQSKQESPEEGNNKKETEDLETAPSEEVSKNKETETTSQMAEVNQFERQVVALTNKERENAGLAPLQLDTKLSQVARKKSKDMATNGYFSHTSPTYGSPFNMMQQSGVNYRTAGENIAKGQRTPEEVVNGWMNSEGHRANILNGDFTHIGVGYVEDGNHWTQQFIGK